MDVKIINPLNDRNWDRKLLNNSNASIFHTKAWAHVLALSYNYNPLYFIANKNSHIRGIIPVMQISSLLTGKRGVSLPFADYCEPLVSNEEVFNHLLSAILDYGKHASWKYFELRGGKEYLPNEIPSETFVEHKIGLSQNLQQIEKNMRNTFIRNIRRAVRDNVQIEISRLKNDFQIFIDLHFLTRKRHGIPPQPETFFTTLYDFCFQDRGYIFLAHYNGQVIAAAIYLCHSKNVICKFAASDLNFKTQKANNLLFYEAIRFFKESGFHWLSFGRTDLKNKGLIHFKNGLTKNTDSLHYYRFNFKKNGIINLNKSSYLSRIILSRMPRRLLSLTGKILYKHIG